MSSPFVCSLKFYFKHASENKKNKKRRNNIKHQDKGNKTWTPYKANRKIPTPSKEISRHNTPFIFVQPIDKNERNFQLTKMNRKRTKLIKVVTYQTRQTSS